MVALNRAYTQIKNYAQAITEGLRAVVADSTYSSAWSNLGWTYYCAGEFDRCIEFSYKAIAFDKGATDAMFNIALATLRKGETAKAADLYRQFVKTCRENHYDINDAAIDNLKELIAAHVYEKDAQLIVNKVFVPATWLKLEALKITQLFLLDNWLLSYTKN